MFNNNAYFTSSSELAWAFLCLWWDDPSKDCVYKDLDLDCYWFGKKGLVLCILHIKDGALCKEA